MEESTQLAHRTSNSDAILAAITHARQERAFRDILTVPGYDVYYRGAGIEYRNTYVYISVLLCMHLRLKPWWSNIWLKFFEDPEFSFRLAMAVLSIWSVVDYLNQGVWTILSKKESDFIVC